jgi:hypothetical protein
MDSGGLLVQRGGAVLSSLLVLCAATAQAQLDEGYQSQQGTRVRGADNGSLERLELKLSSASLGGLHFQQLGIDHGQLKGTWDYKPLAGEELVGVSFTAMDGTEKVVLRIVGARRHVNVYTRLESSTVWEYDVEWESSVDRGVLCPGGAPALALPGRWSAGAYLAGRDAFSFACLPFESESGVGLIRGGVTAKCVEWGYTPWVNLDEMPEGGKSPAQTSSLAARYHTACVAMASADYCGEGRTNTVDGTPIIMFNAGNVKTEVDPSDVTMTPYVAGGPFGTDGEYFFEAAWKTLPVLDPALGEGWRAKALCLSKKRWSTLPINGACMSTSLADPRTGRGDFCEALSADKLLSQESVLFSYSTYIDAGLYRFRNKYTGELLTTAALFIDPKTPFKYTPSIAKADDYELDTSGVGSVFEGPILSRNVPASFPGLALTSRLLRYTDGAGRYVTLVEGAAVPAGYYLDELEGYVYAKTPPMSVPELHFWGRKGSYATTTGNLGPLGYSNLGWTGYLPALKDYALME